MRILLFIASAILSGCVGNTAPRPEYSPSPESLREPTVAEKKIMAVGFAKGLKDPLSAQWQWAPVPRILPMDGPFYYCAAVNSKNSYGGYNGMSPFIGILTVVNGQIANADLGTVGSPDIRYADIVPKMCREKGVLAP